MGIRRTTKTTEDTMTVEHISRTDYEAEAARLGAMVKADNILHGSLVAYLYDESDTDPQSVLEHRRAVAVAAEKEAGTWADPSQGKKKTPSCYYCGVKITRRDGECEDCGPQNVGKKWGIDSWARDGR